MKRLWLEFIIYVSHILKLTVSTWVGKISIAILFELLLLNILISNHETSFLRNTFIRCSIFVLELTISGAILIFINIQPYNYDTFYVCIIIGIIVVLYIILQELLNRPTNAIMFQYIIILIVLPITIIVTMLWTEHTIINWCDSLSSNATKRKMKHNQNVSTQQIHSKYKRVSHTKISLLSFYWSLYYLLKSAEKTFYWISKTKLYQSTIVNVLCWCSGIVFYNLFDFLIFKGLIITICKTPESYINRIKSFILQPITYSVYWIFESMFNIKLWNPLFTNIGVKFLLYHFNVFFIGNMLVNKRSVFSYYQTGSYCTHFSWTHLVNITFGPIFSFLCLMLNAFSCVVMDVICYVTTRTCINRTTFVEYFFNMAVYFALAFSYLIILYQFKLFVSKVHHNWINEQNEIVLLVIPMKKTFRKGANWFIDTYTDYMIKLIIFKFIHVEDIASIVINYWGSNRCLT
eukprot:39098_1